MTDETTPDAVERQYQDSDGNPCDLVTLCRREPEWAASRLTFERARHAEEVAALRDQLRKVEGEREEALRMVDVLRKSEKTARESMVINMRLRDEAQAENVQLKAELTSLRSLLPDVRLIAESAMYETTGGESCPEVLTREARAARRILAALDSQGGEGE